LTMIVTRNDDGYPGVHAIFIFTDRIF